MCWCDCSLACVLFVGGGIQCVGMAFEAWWCRARYVCPLLVVALKCVGVVSAACWCTAWHVCFSLVLAFKCVGVVSAACWCTAWHVCFLLVVAFSALVWCSKHNGVELDMCALCCAGVVSAACWCRAEFALVVALGLCLWYLSRVTLCVDVVHGAITWSFFVCVLCFGGSWCVLECGVVDSGVYALSALAVALGACVCALLCLTVYALSALAVALGVCALLCVALLQQQQQCCLLNAAKHLLN